MIKNALLSLLAVTAGVGTVPSQDGTPLAQTAVTSTLEALTGRVSDLEARVASLEGSGVQALQTAPTASVSQEDLQAALDSLHPGETLVAVNGVPVSGYSQAPQFQPVRQIVQSQPVQRVQQGVRRVIQARPVFSRFGGTRYGTCGPNGCN